MTRSVTSPLPNEIPKWIEKARFNCEFSISGGGNLFIGSPPGSRRDKIYFSSRLAPPSFLYFRIFVFTLYTRARFMKCIGDKRGWAINFAPIFETCRSLKRRKGEGGGRISIYVIPVWKVSLFSFSLCQRKGIPWVEPRCINPRSLFQVKLIQGDRRSWKRNFGVVGNSFRCLLRSEERIDPLSVISYVFLFEPTSISRARTATNFLSPMENFVRSTIDRRGRIYSNKCSLWKT